VVSKKLSQIRQFLAFLYREGAGLAPSWAEGVARK
jgi:hypothetical protein